MRRYSRPVSMAMSVDTRRISSRANHMEVLSFALYCCYFHMQPCESLRIEMSQKATGKQGTGRRCVLGQICCILEGSRKLLRAAFACRMV